MACGDGGRICREWREGAASFLQGTRPNLRLFGVNSCPNGKSNDIKGWLAVVADECEPVSALSVDKLFYFSYLFGTRSPDGGRSGHFARLKTVVMRDTSAVNADEAAAKPDELEPFADQVGAKGLLASDLPGWDCRQLGEDCRYVGRGCRLLGTSLKQSAGAVQGCWQTACL